MCFAFLLCTLSDTNILILQTLQTNNIRVLSYRWALTWLQFVLNALFRGTQFLIRTVNAISYAKGCFLIRLSRKWVHFWFSDISQWVWIFYDQTIWAYPSNLCDAGNFSFTERFAVKYAGAAAMYMVSKKLKKKYNITDERASLYDAANTWVEALDGRDFLGILFIHCWQKKR